MKVNCTVMTNYRIGPHRTALDSRITASNCGMTASDTGIKTSDSKETCLLSIMTWFAELRYVAGRTGLDCQPNQRECWTLHCADIVTSHQHVVGIMTPANGGMYGCQVERGADGE